MRASGFAAVVAVVAIAFASPAHSAGTSTNAPVPLFRLVATMHDCGCDLVPYTDPVRWTCSANFLVPQPHGETPALVHAMLEGEAIAQCGALLDDDALPRRVLARYYLGPQYVDFAASVLVSPVRVYHLRDLGAPVSAD